MYQAYIPDPLFYNLTLQRSSQLQSGFIQVQVVVHFLLQGFIVLHPSSGEGFQHTMNWFANEIHFVIAQKVGYIHVLLDGLWKPFMHYWLTFGEYLCAFMQIFMPYWKFEYTKALILHCGKSGRWYRSWNWGNLFWVKLTSSFSSKCQSKCSNVVVFRVSCWKKGSCDRVRSLGQPLPTFEALNRQKHLCGFLPKHGIQAVH